MFIPKMAWMLPEFLAKIWELEHEDPNIADFR